ncbi:copper resistance D family protein [uncultured Cellulomonas sp.]|uniref:copper resistance D family protein n=1 Tax=uncultured Cellulomonas sp. TaxID=189682 RepID=UPI00261C506D|nr:CopD family protein [uncultured Cellulomonas sp.]
MTTVTTPSGATGPVTVRPDPQPASEPVPRRVAGPGPAGTTALAVLVVLGVLVGAAQVGGAADPVSIGDPGPVTRWGLLVSRTVYDLTAIGTLGTLVVAVLLLPRDGDGFGPDAARLVRVTTRWSAAWAVTAVTTMLLTLSDVAGRPVLQVLAPDVLPLALDLDTTRSLLSSAWLAALVAVGTRVARSPATGLLVLLAAVGAVVLPLLTGHAGHGELPALTATSLALHVVAAAAWVGGLAALVLHVRRSGAALAVALPRFSSLALVCFGLVGVSGAVTGWASLGGLGDLWASSYGRLLLAKLAVLVGLGLAGHLHRRRTIAAVLARRPRGFVRLAAGELVLMGAAAALAVALSHTPPPVQPDHAAPAAASAPAVPVVAAAPPLPAAR